MNSRFDDIRPYYDSEIPSAMHRIANDGLFPLLAPYVFPEKGIEEVRNQILSISTIHEFQTGVMYFANKRIIANSIKEFTTEGFENIERGKSYIYLSNHRDIMLDASLLQNALIDHDFDTTEITFGANLMQNKMVVDIGKSNKMFKVERPGKSIRSFYNSSKLLSEYIRNTITQKHQSLWIAHRNGRTKDGIDRTDQGIITMFRMSGGRDKVHSLEELNILPVSVSYEWEPCDFLKTIEIWQKQKGPYIKKSGEDLNSILTGILQPKGRVHFQICKPISKEELDRISSLPSNSFNKGVAEIVDQRICSSYHLWPNNYIAHDLLCGSDRYSSHYTPAQKGEFVNHLSKLENYAEGGNQDELKQIFLGIYANPVDSAELFNEI